MTSNLIEKTIKTATVAGGCFWCIEGAFNSVKGIEKAISGYMGGEKIAPTYADICKGDSGHAEVVQLHFDSSIITYRQILEIFFSLHNPTQLNRQGNDIGSQYRSAIFTHSAEQNKIAVETIAEMQQGQLFEDDIVTAVSPVEMFYVGEDYHQNYFKNNPGNQYCQVVVSPKLIKFRNTFVEKLK